VGVSTTRCGNGHGFATPDQSSARTSKPLPSAVHKVSRSTIECAVPTFHWKNGKTILKMPARVIKRRGKGTSRINLLSHGKLAAKLA